jgi:hypothetical protein
MKLNTEISFNKSIKKLHKIMKIPKIRLMRSVNESCKVNNE